MRAQLGKRRAACLRIINPQQEAIFDVIDPAKSPLASDIARAPYGRGGSGKAPAKVPKICSASAEPHLPLCSRSRTLVTSLPPHSCLLAAPVDHSCSQCFWASTF